MLAKRYVPCLTYNIWWPMRSSELLSGSTYGVGTYIYIRYIPITTYLAEYIVGSAISSTAATDAIGFTCCTVQ